VRNDDQPKPAAKVNHRVEAVREKAEKVITRIKEYRRRAADAGGRLADGARW
jgi:hypothetical protein